jgi:hypothetical protein
MGITPVLVGGEEDNTWWFDRMSRWGYGIVNMAHDNMRQQLQLIQNAQLVIANDTGFYHAAAAYKKPLFVMWRKTKFIKNRCPSYQDNLGNYYPIFSRSDSELEGENTNKWRTDFDKWFETYTGQSCE